MSTDWLDKLLQPREAAEIAYSNAGSGLTSANVQDAIDEIAGSASLNGLPQAYSEITVTGLTGTHNAWAPAGLDAATSINITSVSGSATINGILAPSTPVNGTVKVLRVYAASITVTLTHNSGSASAGNKIMCDGGHNIALGGPDGDNYVALSRVNGNWFASQLDKRTLTFGASRVGLPTAAPTQHHVVTAASASALQTVLPGAIMPRMSAQVASSTALVFTANQRLIWNGSTTPSFTANLTGAVDGATLSIFFPASLGLTTFTLSTDLDPTGTVAYAFDGGASAYLLTCTYYVTGPCIVSSLRKVTDL